jgi:hypothetical protein
VRLLTLCLLSLAAASAAPPVRFAEHTIAAGLKGGYQVVVADLNGDAKPDLIALASGMQELVWFENPTWQRHVLAANQNRMINCAVVEVEGKSQIVLASEFANEASNSIGLVSVLKPGTDPLQPWSVTGIDRLTTSHRLRAANIDGGGPVVVNAPLTGPHAIAPEYRGHAPLVYYRPGEWKRRVISEANEGVVHGLAVLDWDRDRRDELLTASFAGLHLYKLGRDKQWTRTELSKGDPAPWPKSGSSDIALGQIAKSRYLAAIEPWHGNKIVIYRQAKGIWNRQVIDETLVEGHTILTADLNGDGRDEVIAGYRGKGRGVNVYYAGRESWSREVLDNGGIAANACAAADLNGDGRPDIACIGGATANLKWYENQGPAR